MAIVAKPYKSYGAARELWTARDDEVLLSGPAGTGKSRACLEKVHAACWKFPGCRWLIARKTRESLTESGLVTLEEKVIADSRITDGTQRRVRQIYRFPNGSEIVVGGLDKPSKIMSTEYDGAYVQEATELTEHDWESITTRLRNGVMPFQQIIADCNPDQPRHWLKQRCDNGLTRIIYCRHEDNPTLWDGDRWTDAGLVYLAKLDRLTGARKDRLRHGKWVQAEGVVYDGWNPAVHLIDRFEIPHNWRRIRSIDFGYTNPFVCQWWAIDPDGRMYRYRELYMTGRTVATHAARIYELSKGENYEVTVADHDAEDRATLHEHRIRTERAQKAITLGIQDIESRLALAGDGKPRIYFLRDSLVERDQSLVEAKKPCCTEEEFDCYVWPKGIDGKSLKEVPLDVDNHGMDAMRYAARHVSNPQTMRIY